MSADRAVYLDSSALVKLVIQEPQSVALRRFVRHRRVVSSALARTEVARALLSASPAVIGHGRELLTSIDLIRINDRVLTTAGALPPASLGSLDAIHLATATLLGKRLGRIVTYDERLAAAARNVGLPVAAPK
jgi:predicted nucleic acid-binding protein